MHFYIDIAIIYDNNHNVSIQHVRLIHLMLGNFLFSNYLNLRQYINFFNSILHKHNTGRLQQPPVKNI